VNQSAVARATEGTADLVAYAEELCEQRLAAYRKAPHDVEEHANIETTVLAGGYAYRQVAELIQNAADAIAEAVVPISIGRIVVEADRHGLWCANTGAAVDASGVRALLNSHTSGKRAGQIGRFGLGFKSLLRLGGAIHVFSRTVCLHFNPSGTRALIRKLLNLSPDAPAPGLRLAEPQRWDDEVATAPGAERFNWASTIVFAELVSAGAREAVTAEIEAFPAEFLLFLPCDVDLELRTPTGTRHLRRATYNDGYVTIEDIASDRVPPQRWRVFETSVEIKDQAALDDATAVHARERVPLIWAAPVSGVREAGRFFAFFPTITETRTLGILNAPWKLNSDRTALIPGTWNAALMQHAAQLIVDNISQLGTDEDPGAVLDAFPRELTTSTEPAAPLVNALWALLANSTVLPNCDLETVHPTRLHRAPIDDPGMITAWSHLASAEACESFLHPSCTANTARTGRLRQLADRLSATGGGQDTLPRLRTAAPLEWLQQIASDDPDSAAEALRFSDRYAKIVNGWSWDRLRDNLRLILTADSRLVAAPEATLSEIADPPLLPIHPSLREDPEIIQILRHRFQIQDTDNTDWDRILYAWIERADLNESDWVEVWKILRRMPWDVFTEQVSSRNIRVRTLNGWRVVDEVIRIGGIITADDLHSVQDAPTRNQLEAMLLDEAFHAGDDTWLVELGVSRFPAKKRSEAYVIDDDSIAGSWLASWKRERTSSYHAFLDYRPDRHLLGPDDFELPAAWQLLLLSPVRARALVTAWFLEIIADDDPSAWAPVLFRHSSRRHTWKTRAYRHPFITLLMQNGMLANAQEQIALSLLLRPDMADTTAKVPSLSPFVAPLSKLRVSVHQGTEGGVDEVWSNWLRFASGEDLEPQVLAAFFEEAAEGGRAPDRICTPVGPIPLTEIRVASSLHEIALARQAGITAICLSARATQLWISRGARALEQDATLDWISDSDNSPTVLLLDLEPALRDVLKQGVAETASATMPALMERKIGDHHIPIEWTLEDGQLLIAQTAMSDNNWHGRMKLLVDAATAAGWIEDEHALDKVLTSGVSARRRQIAAEPDLPARLLRATGGGHQLLTLFEDDVQHLLANSSSHLAAVALTMFGPALLSMPIVRDAMRDQGLEPPQRWGTDAAADFVAAIGFPPEYAISPTQRREAELAISGPLPLKALHDFQVDIVASLKKLFSDTTSRRRRAVISLPTGAGKTRVAAETAVRDILALESANRLVLWIAQSDELCEQAVQCFRELWSNIGTVGETLRLIRFWGGQINPSPTARGEPTVIVASIQTLTSRMNNSALDWASRPGLIVIDECHHALTPAYSGLLRWLNHGDLEQEPPVVGLSATPFRGRSDDETKLLASRFDHRLFPQEQKHLFELMQDRGVLARFTYFPLVMHGRFVLTEAEERYLEKFQQLNDTALKRLGEDAERNDKILEVVASAKEKSTLIFATSVEHAQRLAARLNVMGISAASVTGETDRASRRWFIQAFQCGDVNVLCNHSALTTGFDAPATDLIVIARPVFSPALFMQMVGRGLRGPANGGKEFCRIVTVQDNLDAYTGKLAHNYFEQYYVSTAG
jgi:superfamily II DNA or RNA helicase